MAGISNYLQPKVLDRIFRNVAGTGWPATCFAALYTTASPGDDGLSGVEVAAGDYARQSVAFAAATTTQIANSADVTFTNSAGSAWGTISGIALWDALTAGNLLWVGTITPSIVVTSGVPVKITAGSLIITAD